MRGVVLAVAGLAVGASAYHGVPIGAKLTSLDRSRRAPSHRATRAPPSPVAMAYGKATVPNAEEAAKKNPSLRKADKFKGMKLSERPTKKNTRNRIMKRRSTSVVATHLIGKFTRK